MTQKRIVLVGGGHAHALFLQQWDATRFADVELVVIEPHEAVPYTGMLPGFVAGHYAADKLYVPIAKLTKQAGGVFVSEKAVHIDPITQRVITETGEYAYDYVSVDIGIHAQLPEIPGFAEHAVGVKPLGDFAARWQDVCDRNDDEDLNIVILGAGVAGTEIALAMRHRLDSMDKRSSTITIIERGEALTKVSGATRAFLKSRLQENTIDLREHTAVREIKSGRVMLEAGELPANFVLGAAGARPYDWIAQTCVPTTDGYIAVNETLRSSAYPNVFAVGDCAHFSPRPLVKAGVYAVRQAPILHHNIIALLDGRPLRTFVPQADYLKLISLGSRQAAADKWGMVLHGRLLWQLKNYIDRAFMQKLSS